MRPGYFFFGFLILLIVTCGCMTPAKVANETPDVINDFVESAVPTADARATLYPLETSANYVPPPRVTLTLKPVARSDPIIGGWKYIGTGYVCDAEFVPDNTGYVKCYQGFVTFLRRSFTWISDPESTGFMGVYRLQDSNNVNYTVMYSDRTGMLTSDFIPDGGYFAKVS